MNLLNGFVKLTNNETKNREDLFFSIYKRFYITKSGEKRFRLYLVFSVGLTKLIRKEKYEYFDIYYNAEKKQIGFRFDKIRYENTSIKLNLSAKGNFGFSDLVVDNIMKKVFEVKSVADINTPYIFNISDTDYVDSQNEAIFIFR